ncbi:hypothetical protein LSTR_LSTR015234, partial [Laodelphax striatellus]
MPVIFNRKHIPGGDHPLASSISQLLNYQRGIVPLLRIRPSTPPLKSVFDIR